MKYNLRQEIERRKKDEDTVFAVLGPEFRLRRLRLKKALKFVSYRLCSISYVSKIESSSIRPTPVYLNEISSRLGMDMKDVDGLLKLKDALLVAVNSVLTNDYSELKEIVSGEEKYLNYRYKLLQFFYDISINNLDVARDEYLELSKIARSMTHLDFKVFIIASVMYLYKTGSILEAYDLIYDLSQIELSKELMCITHLYLFYTSNALLKPETINYYNTLKEELLLIGSYNLLDEINYYYAIYYLKAGSPKYALEIINTIKDNKKRESIKFLGNYLLGKAISTFKRKDLYGFAKCFYDYKFSKDYLEKDIEEINQSYYQIDFSMLIFKYLMIPTPKGRTTFVSVTASREITLNEDEFIKKFFIEQSFILAKETGKYKLVFDIYNDCTRKG